MWAAPGVPSRSARVGTSRAATTSSSSEAFSRGSSGSKRWVPWRRPPATNAHPSTSTALARMEPTRAACTTVVRPSRRANSPTNSSGRLPERRLQQCRRRPDRAARRPARWPARPGRPGRPGPARPRTKRATVRAPTAVATPAPTVSADRRTQGHPFGGLEYVAGSAAAEHRRPPTVAARPGGGAGE